MHIQDNFKPPDRMIKNKRFHNHKDAQPLARGNLLSKARGIFVSHKVQMDLSGMVPG